MDGWVDGCCVGEPWRAEWAHEERGGVGSREEEALAAEWCDGLALWGAPAVRGRRDGLLGEVRAIQRATS